MNLYPETMVDVDMYNVHYKQPHTIYAPVLFEPIIYIIISCAMFKVTSSVYFGLYLN